MNKDDLAAALARVVEDSDGSSASDSIYPARDPVSQQMLDAVKGGYVPTLAHCPVPPFQGEIAHFFFENVWVVERLVVSEKIVGSSSGFTIYDDSMAFSFGHSEGRVVRKTADRRVASGSLLMTNLRLVLMSPQRGLSLIWQDVLGFTYSHSEIQVATAGPSTRIECRDPELVAWCASACMSRVGG